MKSLNCNGFLLSLDTPKIMGILNVTPDSFFDGGKYSIVENAVRRAEEMIEEGASIIDVGGMSSRPGAEIINPSEELKRVVPTIKEIKRRFPEIIVSIDTVHSEVAETAVKEGAGIINDISGGEIDSHIWNVASDHSIPYILMHMKGRPNSMQNDPSYTNVSLDILSYLRDKVEKLKKLGVKDIVIDPGFGFGKTVDQNYELLKNLSSFRILDCPILVGLSRKSMIYKLLEVDAYHALNGTTACHMIALQNGVKLLRVHDVKEAKQCIIINNQL